MLVVSRKIQQEIMIGDDIRIVVVNVSGGTVKIGIDAPKAKRIHRREIYETVPAEGGEQSTNV